MLRFFVMVLGLAITGEGFFLTLPDSLKGLIPDSLAAVFKTYTPEQVKLLTELEGNKSLGMSYLDAVSKLRVRINKLPASVGSEKVESYYNLLTLLADGKGQEGLKKLIKGYEKLSKADKIILENEFPEIIRTIDSPKVHQYVNLPPVVNTQ